MEKRGLKIAWVAKKSKMEERALYNIVEGRRKSITLKEAYQISRTLEMDLEELFPEGEIC